MLGLGFGLGGFRGSGAQGSPSHPTWFELRFVIGFKALMVVLDGIYQVAGPQQGESI